LCLLSCHSIVEPLGVFTQRPRSTLNFAFTSGGNCFQSRFASWVARDTVQASSVSLHEACKAPKPSSRDAILSSSGYCLLILERGRRLKWQRSRCSSENSVLRTMFDCDRLKISCHSGPGGSSAGGDDLDGRLPFRNPANVDRSATNGLLSARCGKRGIGSSPAIRRKHLEM